MRKQVTFKWKIALFSYSICVCLSNVIITIVCWLLTVRSDLKPVWAGQNETDGETRKIKEDEKQLGHHEERKRRDIQERRREKKENKGWVHQHKLFISMTSARW